MKDNPAIRDAGPACAPCALANRRRFLHTAAVSLAGALIALGVPRRAARAFPLRPVRARRRAGNTVTYAVPATDGAQIDHDNQVILVRWQNVGYAFNLSCPHQNTALRWDDADRRFECPKHHSKYEPDGTFISGRATRSMDRLGITLQNDHLVVDLDEFYRQDRNPAQWKAAFVTFAG